MKNDSVPCCKVGCRRIAKFTSFTWKNVIFPQENDRQAMELHYAWYCTKHLLQVYNEFNQKPILILEGAFYEVPTEYEQRVKGF